MAIVSLLMSDLSFGGAPLLDPRQSPGSTAANAWCLVGRNGAGKSTLDESHRRELAPDVGQVFRQVGRPVFSTLKQEVPAGLTGTVRTVVEGEGGGLRGQHNDWERHDRGPTPASSKIGPAASKWEFASLSGRTKTPRACSARTRGSAQLLLLDETEPTISILASIQWLGEEFLLEVGRPRFLFRALTIARFWRKTRGPASSGFESRQTYRLGVRLRLNVPSLRKQASPRGRGSRARAVRHKKLGAGRKSWIRRGVESAAFAGQQTASTHWKKCARNASPGATAPARRR